MKKFVNHIDHVTWISHLENIEANVAELEKVTGTKLERFEHKDVAFVMYVNWEAGLEVVSPTAVSSADNAALRERLKTHGEGVVAVVFGVRDLDKHKARMEALGVEVGPLMEGHEEWPWKKDKLVLRERFAGGAINTWFVAGQIDYGDDVISFEDV